ncbi:hypothetical protein [Thalassospira xiamenensis]|uniref:hypothetical protein n=1 Tax=Thalassospira xiamenensis TaxID=220697 RepID=UPI000DED756B|nr:hypothetical protein [Thalassospira xiamenensis]RCK37257.1 hypothetical protein TH24_16920 [Thalassospira xiamenensis]
MTRLLAALIGASIATVLSGWAIFGLFDINWLNSSHRAGLADLTGWPLEAYSFGHLWLFVGHLVGLIAICAGLLLGWKFLADPLRAVFRQWPKLIYLAYPVAFLWNRGGRLLGQMIRVRVPKPRIEARIEWNAPAPTMAPETEQPARKPVTLILDPVKTVPEETQQAVSQASEQSSETQDTEEQETGLVYSDPMAELEQKSEPPVSAPVFDPEAGLPFAIDQLRELGYETRVNLQVNAADGGFVPDVFDADPKATVQLVAIDAETIYLIETVDLGNAQWSVQTMADMHDASWADAEWKSPIGNMPCPATRLARTRERFSSALLARLNMNESSLISLLVLRNGTLEDQAALSRFTEAEDIELAWFDKPSDIDRIVDPAEGKMAPFLLNIITQPSRNAA